MNRRTIVIAETKRDGRDYLAVCWHLDDDRPIIVTPRAPHAARGQRGAALHVTPRMQQHPMLPVLLSEVGPCFATRPSHTERMAVGQIGGAATNPVDLGTYRFESSAARGPSTFQAASDAAGNFAVWTAGGDARTAVALLRVLADALEGEIPRG